MLNLNDHLGGYPPRERPYDVLLNRRLALRVFPNGARTWVYWRSPQQDPRGRTIGVFPDMNAEQALEDTNTVLEWERFRDLPQAELPDSTAFIQSGNIIQLRRRNQWRQHWLWRSAVAAGITLAVLAVMRSHLQTETVPGGDRPAAAVTAEAAPETVPSRHVEAGLPERPVSSPQRTAPESAPSAGLERTTAAPDEASVAASRRDGNPDAALQVAAGLAAGTISRASFTSAVLDHEPVDRLAGALPLSENEPALVYFFTDVRNLAGETVIHRWWWRGELHAENRFHVGSNWRWRVYSMKRIEPEQTGMWAVEVTTEGGALLGRYPLEVLPAGALVAERKRSADEALGPASEDER